MPPSVYFYFPGRTESTYLRERIAETFNPQKKLLKAFVGIMQQIDRALETITLDMFLLNCELVNLLSLL